MSKQLLIYEKALPVSKIKHRNWSVKAGNNYEFTKDINSVPLSAIEFPNAAKEYSIVFSGNDEAIFPVAVMGVREDENLYLTSDNKISAGYIPAFLRRYPFIFSSVDNGENLTLCIDESFSGCNQENIGERLFDANGEQTSYLKSILEFLKEYKIQFTRTKTFCRRLAEWDLLEPMSAQIIISPKREKIVLSGFSVVSRKKLKNLSGEKLQMLARTDELELIYIHLQSLSNFGKFVDKVQGKDEQVLAV